MKYFNKEAMQATLTNHFWDRAFGRPAVKRDLARIEFILKKIGNEHTFVEDVPELQPLLLMKNKRFLFQEEPSRAKYIFDLKKDPVTDKHKLVAVTGLKPEYTSTNLEDITPILLRLAT